MPSKFITVYQVRDGKKRDVPRSWMDHPEISKQFRKTPKTKAGENAADNTSGSADSGSSTSSTTSSAPRGTNKS